MRKVCVLDSDDSVFQFDPGPGLLFQDNTEKERKKDLII